MKNVSISERINELMRAARLTRTISLGDRLSGRRGVARHERLLAANNPTRHNRFSVNLLDTKGAEGGVRDPNAN